MVKRTITLVITAVLTAAVIGLWAASSAAEPVFLFSADRAASAVTIQGGELLATPQGKGWKALSSQQEEAARVPEHVIGRKGVQVKPEEGTIDILVERMEPLGEPVRFETLVAFEDPALTGNYPFAAVYYIEWNSALDGKPLLYIDGWGPTREKLESVWGTNIPFPIPVEPDEKVHIRITWGPDGPSSNRIYFNGVEALHYYLDGGESESTRTGDFAAILPVGTDLRLGNSLQSPLVGSILYGVIIYDEALSSDLPYGHGLPEIDSVTHDALEVVGYSGKLVAGDVVSATMKADPGGVATFDLGGITGIPMVESGTEPGVYVGARMVQYGDELEDGGIIGRFTNTYGVPAVSVTADRSLDIDTTVYLTVNAGDEILPADRESRAGVSVSAADANGKAVRGHPLKLTMSTTGEYTGIVGGGTFDDLVGGELDVKWKGVTDSSGSVSAEYVSGFAAKTIIVSAKDMVTGDVGAGFIRSFIEGTVEIVVKPPIAVALAAAGTLEVSVSRDWLTADGRSKTRITAVARDADGNPVKGNRVEFRLVGDNGRIKTVRSKTDSKGRALADYIAGIRIGQVQVEVRDLTSGLSATVSIELRSDAPAEIALTADPPELVVGDGDGSTVSAKVTDANGNPNTDTEVLFQVMAGEGNLSADAVLTDNRDGVAQVIFWPGEVPGISTVKATVTSRAASEEELSAAEGALFLYGLDKDPGRLYVDEWLAEPGDEVVRGQGLVILVDRRDNLFTVASPRDGKLSIRSFEEKDEVQYGQTLGYVLVEPE